MTSNIAIEKILNIEQKEIDFYFYKKYIKIFKKLKQLEKSNFELRRIVEEYKWKEFYKEFGEEYINYNENNY